MSFCPKYVQDFHANTLVGLDRGDRRTEFKEFLYFFTQCLVHSGTLRQAENTLEKAVSLRLSVACAIQAKIS